MAATVSAWAKPGAWALDSEENEHELLQQQKENSDSNNNTASDFPSLAAAASTKTKKKKPQALTLGEFSSYASKPAVRKTYQAIKGFSNEEFNLPTGPRERTPEELDRSRLGGGFRSYGDRNSNDSRWGSDERRERGFERRERGALAPSRADEIDDWGVAKKSTIGGAFERRERGERGGFFSDSHSRADDSDSWVSNKSFVPSEGRRGGGFDSLRERRGGGLGFESNGGADSDNWGRKKEDEGRRFGSGGGAFDSLRERRGGNENGGADSDSWGKRRGEGITDSGTGGGKPRLNLHPRKLPVGETQTVAVKANKGSNPFGDARPREQVLKEKGQDWKEIDEKLESMKMKDAGSGDGASSFGRRSFGSGDGWRKNGGVAVEVRPPSAEPSENGATEEAEDSDPQM